MQRTAAEYRQLLSRGDYGTALQIVAGLGGLVDALFDGVMVMAEEERVKINRLALLTAVARLLEQIADFSRLAE